MPSFDEKGYLIPPPAVNPQEKDAVYNLAKAVDSDQAGLALSHLRAPNSKMSLQRVEAIAVALVNDGKLTVVRKQTVKGGFYDLYTWK